MILDKISHDGCMKIMKRPKIQNDLQSEGGKKEEMGEETGKQIFYRKMPANKC